MGRLHRLVLWLLALVSACVAREDGRWVWGASGRSIVSERDPYYNRDRFPPANGGNYRPPPPIYEPEPGPDSRPPPPPPTFGGPDYRPRPPGPPRPPPPPPGTPVLTGPVPSWEQGRPPGGFKSFDRCKCAHSFNCNSPGIVFGSCDAGKQYCCYDVKPQNEGFGVDRPPFGGVGGVGPVTFGGRPDGPRDGPDVLVGPGGPTGVVGGPRPRPEFYDDEEDYDPFSRSAKKDKKL